MSARNFWDITQKLIFFFFLLTGAETKNLRIDPLHPDACESIIQAEFSLCNLTHITFFFPYAVPYPLGPTRSVSKAKLPAQFSERCKLSAYNYDRENSLLNYDKKENTTSLGI